MLNETDVGLTGSPRPAVVEVDQGVWSGDVGCALPFADVSDSSGADCDEGRCERHTDGHGEVQK